MTKIARRTQPRPATSARALPKEVTQLQRNKKATTTKNADGSVTRRRQTAKTDKSVTTSEGKLLETKTEFRKSATTSRGTRSESNFTQQTDMIGRASTSSRRETTNARGDQTVSTRGTDVFGIEQRGTERTTQRERNGVSESAVRSRTTDSRGNAQTASDVTRVRQEGTDTITTNAQRTQGSRLDTRSSTTYENGTFRLADGADWSRTNSVGRSFERTRDYDASRTIERYDRAANRIGQGFKALGLNEEWSSQVAPERMRQNTVYQSDHASVTTQVGVTGGQRFAINGEGIQASYDREASARVTATSHGEVSGRYGTANYNARAEAVASASVNAQGRIDSNGLDASVNLRARAAVEAEVTARAQTQSVRFLGTDLSASVDGRARAVAEVQAEATGQVRVTRNPPTAIIEGTAGASAVAKVEGEVRASAGPFSVTANGYASAGAEARASGVLGYSDGKLRIGGSVGAALGLGLGGGVQVEVDVAQIQQMAHNAADRDGDGQLGLGDVVAGARQLADVGGRAATAIRNAADVNGDGRVDLRDAGAAARNTTRAVAQTAQRTVQAAQQTVQRAATAVRNAADVNGDGRIDARDAGAAASRAATAVTQTAQRAATAVADTASRAASAVSSGARRVAGWFGF